MADKRLTYVLTANDNATMVFKKVAAAGEDSNKRIAASSDRTAKSLERQTKNTHLLSTGLLTLGSAAIPVAAVATGLGGLAVAGGVALLAVKGIQKEMKAGTPTGQAFTKSLSTLQGNLSDLEHAAAGGVLSGFQKSVKALQPQMPALTRDTAMYAHQLGDIGGNTGLAAVSLLRQFHPLFAQVGSDLDSGSAKLANWAKSSDGIKRFVAYAQTNLPVVEQTFSSLVTTASHVVMGLEPFGSTSLTAIKLFSQAVNAIPVGVLQTLLPVLAGLRVGNTLGAGFNNAAGGIEKFATRLGSSRGLASGASGAIGGLGKAVGFLGPVGVVAGLALGGLSVAMGSSKRAAIEDQKRVNELSAAIQNQTIKTEILSQLQASGAVKAGQQLGVTQSTLVQAVIQHGAALDLVKAKIATANTQYQAMNVNLGNLAATQGQVNDPKGFQAAVDARNNLYNSLTKLSGGLQQEIADYDKAKTQAAAWAKQQGDAALATDISSGAFQAHARQLGVDADAYVNAKLAADKQAQAVAASTLQMQLANDAAGLLKQSLDELDGKELSVGQATTSWGQSLLSLTKSLHDNGKTVADNTDKGIANRQAIEGSVSAAQQQAQAIANATRSTKAGTAAYNKDGQAILDRIAKQNGDKTATDRAKDAAYRYAQQLLGLGKIKVPPTKVDLDKAAAERKIAEFKHSLITIPGYRTSKVQVNSGQALARLKDIKDHLNDLDGRTATSYVNVVTYQTNAANKNLALAGRQSGGPVVAGVPYIVGEIRPEVFVPDTNGRIVPRVPATGGGSIYVTVNVAGHVTTERGLIAAVEQGLRESLRRRGKASTASML